MSFSDTDSGSGFGVQGTSISADGVLGESDTGPGVLGSSGRGPGVVGRSKEGTGVAGVSSKGAGVTGTSAVLEGVIGESKKSHGVRGHALDANATGVVGIHDVDGDGVAGVSKGGNGVFGQSDFHLDKKGSGVFGLAHPAGYGVYGYSPRGPAGTVGQSDAGIGIFGQSGSDSSAGVHGQNTGAGTGVRGSCSAGEGVVGVSDKGAGVHGHSASGAGVAGEGSTGIVGKGTSIGALLSGDFAIWAKGVTAGVVASGSALGVTGEGGFAGVSGKGPFGVQGDGDVSGVIGLLKKSSFMGGVTGAGSSSRTGVFGSSESGNGVVGMSVDGAGVVGWSPHPTNVGPFGFAGNFKGAVNVTGPVHKSGGGFRIDHPLAPTDMYLNHSFVESPDMKNVYDGVAVLDRKGGATVTLPEWFETLNREFRYQLTAVGGAAPNLHIGSEMRRGRFRIAGGTRGMKVCWQVTGIRRDPWAEANRIRVEEKKTRIERGTYRHPEVYGKPDDLSVEWIRHPDLLKILKKRGGGRASLVSTYRELIRETLGKLEANTAQARRMATGAVEKSAAPLRKRPANVRKVKAEFKRVRSSASG